MAVRRFLHQPNALINAVENLVNFFEGSWDLTTDLALAGDDPLSVRLDAGWRQFRQAVLAALTEQEEIASRTAAAAARNCMRTRDMQAHMTDMQASMDESVQVIQSVAGSALEATAAVEHSAATVDQTRTATLETARTAATMANSVGDIAGFLSHISGQLVDLSKRSREIEDLSKVVKGIATRVNLLSLNASIEAARAGAHGRGFAVVASEVRRLADQTTRQANEIETVIKQVVGQLETAGNSMAEGIAKASTLTKSAADASRTAATIEDLIAQITAPVQELSATVQDHSQTLQNVSGQVGEASGHLGAMGQQVDLVADEAVSLLRYVRDGQQSLTRFEKGTFQDQMKRTAQAMAGEIANLFESVLADGRLTLDDVLALEYREIKGESIQALSRLFDVTKVPAEGFRPPKYATRYDHLVDVALREVLDRYLGSHPKIVFTSLMDLNGYQPSATSGTSRAWTGDFAQDVLNNRAKRFTTDEDQMESARIGLSFPLRKLDTPEPYVRDMRSVVTRQDLVRAGNPLKQEAESADLCSVVTYASRSGKVTTQLGIPVYIRGHRYGVAMVGWVPDVQK